MENDSAENNFEAVFYFEAVVSSVYDGKIELRFDEHKVRGRHRRRRVIFKDFPVSIVESEVREGEKVRYVIFEDKNIKERYFGRIFSVTA